MATHPPEVFVRKASGLVRNLSSFDALNLNVAMCSPLQGILWAWTWGPVMFPGVNLALSYLIGIAAVGGGAALTYTLWTIAMPRSGGDYVWFSRGVHPAYGFVINWFLTFVFLTWFGLNTATVGPFFLGTLFISLGMKSVSDMVSSPAGAAMIGTVSVALSALLVLAGTKIYAKIYLFLLAITLVGTFVFAALLVTSSNASFIAGFDHAMADTTSYQGVLDKAKELGWVPGWTASATLMGLVFPFQNYSWAGFPSYVAGEIRNIDKSAWVGIMGGLLFMGVWYVAIGGLIYSVVGLDFVHALSYLFNNASSSYPLPYPPYPQNYVFFLTQNQAIIFIVALGWLCSGIYLTPPNLFLATRNIFAWSFDRILPTSFSKVTERFHTPIYCILVATIIGEILMLWTVYATYSVMIINTFMIMEVVLSMVGLATIIFPFTRKSMFERFPDPVKRKVAGVPLMTISGLVMLLLSLFMVYAAATAPALGGLNSASFLFNLGMLLISVPIFYASYAYHKKRGIDISIQFKEIPPE